MTQTPINYVRLLLPIVLSFLFILMGIYLIRTKTGMGEFFGYANVIFFGFLILFVITKIAIHHIKRKSA